MSLEAVLRFPGQADSVSILSSESISSVPSECSSGAKQFITMLSVSSQMQPPHSLAGILTFPSIMDSRFYDPLEVKSLTLLSPGWTSVRKLYALYKKED